MLTTVASFSALNTVSVFILSSTTTAWPFLMRSPTATLTSTTKLGIGARIPPPLDFSASFSSEINHPGDGIVNRKRCRASSWWKICNFSSVAETPVPGTWWPNWEMTVVRDWWFPIVACNEVESGNDASILVNSAKCSPPAVYTWTSNRPCVSVLLTWTWYTSSGDAVREMMRLWTSPPNLRKDNVLHGELVVGVWSRARSRSTMYNALCARTSPVGLGITGKSASWCFYNCWEQVK